VPYFSKWLYCIISKLEDIKIIRHHLNRLYEEFIKDGKLVRKLPSPDIIRADIKNKYKFFKLEELRFSSGG